MQELLGYQFLSWLQFAMIAFIVSLLLYGISRLQFFSAHAKEKSIGYRMFMYLLIMVIIVSFLLVRPFYHFLFLIVVFGIFYKNILSYSRVLFSLYFSNIKFGDRIKIGDVQGKLDSMNFGGLHVLTTDNKVYFPFYQWKANKIILESESGKVLVSFECEDQKGREEYQSIYDLKKSLFNYPYLAVSNVIIEKNNSELKVAVRISDSTYRNGLFDHITKAGFRLTGNKI